ncbi:SDR family NAD(P)-dependent oxidoreductase [Pseudonocardia endophytica]|uniref:Short-subunit dehydrogenase n=1 Tax=Pseudonocardia endophytica TaxID=401976 RepID=A0A4R1HSY4_PSEEN|nr:SDR family oxidoreductase [Pseudonocardia endophytica]TCK25298.1 short-subunit dehydrogenase [Pseudonocardia endophytica]
MAYDTALVTGAGTGFGLALTTALARRGTRVTTVARDADRLAAAVSGLPGVTVAPGDITDPTFRAAVADRLGERLDLLVHNAGELGPSPLPPLADYPLDALRAVLETTVVAPLGLTRLLLPALRRSPAPAVVTLSSDVAVEAYPGWGGYGAAKAALDRLATQLGVEEPGIRVHAFDPGDMRTAMHQAAFPGEDISDRPEPETVVPALLRLLDERPPSGRYRASDLAGSPA